LDLRISARPERGKRGGGDTGQRQVKQGVAFTSIGTYATAGVLDLVVELMPEDGEPVEATLRVVANVSSRQKGELT